MTLGIQCAGRPVEITPLQCNITTGPRHINISDFVPTFSYAELERNYKLELELEESRLRNRLRNSLYDFKKGK